VGEKESIVQLQPHSVQSSPIQLPIPAAAASGWRPLVRKTQRGRRRREKPTATRTEDKDSREEEKKEEQ
jgi:hypothetical protein